MTNARASDDYAGGSDNLLSMPHAALLMWSLGIRPSKVRSAAAQQAEQIHRPRRQAATAEHHQQP